MKRNSEQSVGIRDVAKAAGVSLATASRVMAKADYPVAKETREKVILAARELGFLPNALARGLVRSRTDTIGVIVPGIMNPYYAAMVEAIDVAARDQGLRTLLGLTSGDEGRREEIVNDLVSQQADGLIICAGADDHRPVRDPTTLRVPAILIGEQANPGFPIIRTDNFRAGREAAEYLWSLGHRSFLYLTTLPSWHDFHQRGRGMLDFLRGKGEAHRVQVFDQLFSETDTYRRVFEAFEDGPVASAILASTDRHALGAMAALTDVGLSVPRDVSVMGFDDYVTSGFVRPSLSTMQMPAADMGRHSVAVLTEMLQDREVNREFPFYATLVKRESTAVIVPSRSPG